MLREELQLLQEPGSYVGEVIKVLQFLPVNPAPSFRFALHYICTALHTCIHPTLPAQVMGKNKILVKVHPEGKYVVDLHKDIDINKVATGARVALRNDSYTLHLLLPTKVDPLVSLMKVEKVPDSTYDMIGGLDQQIKEIKEVTSLRAVIPCCSSSNKYVCMLTAVIVLHCAS